MKSYKLFDDNKIAWYVFGRDEQKPDSIIDTNEYAIFASNEVFLLDPVLAVMPVPRRASSIANTIRAGVTLTPALMKIPEKDAIIEAATRRNPTGRMTTPQDVASTILALSGDGTDFINGEVIGVDGGEFITGS